MPYPANTIHWSNVVLMLGHRRRDILLADQITNIENEMCV